MIFTGERFIPTEQGRIRLEHYHRYAIVLSALSDKDVLDVACGEGYGSSMMADVAKSVIGVDVSQEAVDNAKSSYKKTNLTYQQGSASDLGFSDESFDVVVSFETIEHLMEQEEMISEISRVLRPNGRVIISSPNRPVFHEEYGADNEYHVKELDFQEFDLLLRNKFKFVDYYGQRMTMGSMIRPVDREVGSYTAWHDNGETLKQGAGGTMVDPVYFLAICTNDKNDMLLIDPSLVLPDETDLVRYYLGLAKWAQNVVDEMSELQFAHEVRVNQLNAEIDVLQNAILLMKHSLSWKITRPMRMLSLILKKTLRS